MVEPINLNKARKARARAQKEKRAAENRVKYGLSKAEKAKLSKDAGQREKTLRDAKIDRELDSD